MASPHLLANAMVKVANVLVAQERLECAVNTVNTVSGTMESMDAKVECLCFLLHKIRIFSKFWLKNATAKLTSPWVQYATSVLDNAIVRRVLPEPDVTSV